jgi:carbamoyltransferase|tara:strand:- start:287 stop:1981 length:1695 start_codon:yes stop_codon:yes gene_type:complete
MKILGINYLSESSISLIENRRLKFCLSEERINRIKNWYGNPYKSVNQLLNKFNIKAKDIDYISTHGIAIKQKKLSNKEEYNEKIDLIIKSKLSKKKKKYQIEQIKFRKKKEEDAIKRAKKLINDLKKKFKKKIYIYDHHTCHAASAAYFSGWKKSYVLTIDGWGDDSSAKLFKFSKNKLHHIRSTSLLNSLGYFYGSITKCLGFQPHRDEGKVLGLAAYGNFRKAYSDISKMISFNYKKKNFTSHPEKGLYLPSFQNKNLNYLLKKYNKQDIAAATQKRLEDLVIEYIKFIDKKPFKLTLAGGVFSNVKLNQKILQLKKVKDVFIFPNMGDGGLAVGAATLCYLEKRKIYSKKLNNVYYGLSFSNEEIKKELIKYNLKYVFNKKITKQVAKEIFNGKTIGIFQGRMEFGPRALGNRSIFCNARNSKINASLNRKLGRTEFMPFAPITLDKYANKMYLNYNKGKCASKFMTVTFKCTKKMKQISPATVHIDGTARPQIIDYNSNPKIYNLLKEYLKISKIPNMINTSFNMHEEPIVYTPRDAIKSFLSSKIDYLFIGDFLASKRI